VNFPTPELIAMLSRALGDTKARHLVEDSLRELGFDAAALDQEQAQRILEHLTKHKGLVGISARFALSRLHLR
jgi:hypothetical protein